MIKLVDLSNVLINKKLEKNSLKLLSDNRKCDHYSLASSRERETKIPNSNQKRSDLENTIKLFNKVNHKNSGRMSKRKGSLKKITKREGNLKTSKVLLRV